MQFESNNIYHVYNRGNNSQKIFLKKDNYIFFLQKIRIHLLPFADVLAWCLMPNHFHLMIYVNTVEIFRKEIQKENKDKFGVSWGSIQRDKLTLNQSIAILLRSYTRAINIQENRTGSLFQMKTKAKCLTDNSEITSSWFDTVFGTIINIPDEEMTYPKRCFNYIHQNPVTGKLVHTAEDWEFSSYQDYSGKRKGKLINRKLAREFGLIE